jgi:hypothetical protein
VTYVELLAEIQNYTQNYESQFVATIPTFVTQAEERIYNSVGLERGDAYRDGQAKIKVNP